MRIVGEMCKAWVDRPVIRVGKARIDRRESREATVEGNASFFKFLAKVWDLRTRDLGTQSGRQAKEGGRAAPKMQNKK